MTDTAENIAALAAAFAALLQRDLTPEQWAEMRVKNASAEYGEGVCASHDYVDANMTMDSAFRLVVGREAMVDADGSPMNDADITLWNEAWGRATSLYLTAES